MTIEPIHLLPEIKCNSGILMYSKFSTGNYSIAGKGGHWPASKNISFSLHYLIVVFRCTVEQTVLRRTMLDLFAYCPNAPPCMMTPPPSERHATGYSERQVREMLPKPELVDVFIGDVLMLTGNDVPASVSRHPRVQFHLGNCSRLQSINQSINDFSRFLCLC